MTLAVYLVLVLASAVFTAACAWRAAVYARSPLHLRWELYPVPHEPPERTAHGGSYFEQSEWWRQPRHVHLLGELKFMLPEMLFLHALRTHNRPLWYRSFPFHFGLYLAGGSAALLLAAVGADRLFGAAPVVSAARSASAVVGLAGLASCICGACALLHRRLTDPALRVSTAPGDLFNLAFFVGALALLAAGWALRPAGTAGAFGVVSGLFSWDLSVPIAAPFGAGLVAAAALAAYIPLTHMSHFIAKYFTYHSVRWDDEAGVHNAARAKTMAEYLTYRPTWSASHVGADGSRTWADIATANPVQERRS